MPGFWNLPGGAIEPGETPIEAAVRETREETNLNVLALTCVALASVPTLLRETVYAFRVISWQGQLKLDGENDQFVWLPKDALVQSDFAIVPLHREVLRKFA